MAKPFYLSFSSEVNHVTGPALIAAIGHQMATGHDEAHLLLTTPGGRVDMGLMIYNVLRSLPIKVITYNVGTVNSIGNMIFLAGVERYAAPTSSFMFHGVGFDVQNARFEEKALKERLTGLQNDQKLIADVIVRHTNISAADVGKLFLEAAFVTADDAKARGIVNDVIEIKIPEGATFLQLAFQG